MLTIYQSFNDSEYCGDILLDFSKAFDSVPQILSLPNKLLMYGFRGKVHFILTSFLANRQQFVFVNDYKSEKLHVLYRVLYGSF